MAASSPPPPSPSPSPAPLPPDGSGRDQLYGSIKQAEEWEPLSERFCDGGGEILDFFMPPTQCRVYVHVGAYDGEVGPDEVLALCSRFGAVQVRHPNATTHTFLCFVLFCFVFC